MPSRWQWRSLPRFSRTTIWVFISTANSPISVPATRQFQLQQVDRGIHTLQAVILDAAGAEVIRTLAVTFMMQQTSINFPNNPNNPNRAPAAGG